MKESTVAVIGAGAAGLAAAAKLFAAGHSVTVIEARRRIGGRIWTDRTLTPYPVERGAEFIHGDATVTWNFLKRTEAVKAGESDAFLVYWNGRWEPAGKLYAQWNASPYFSIADSFEWHSDKMQKMELKGRDSTTTQWLKTSRLPTAAQRLIGFEMANPYLARPSELGVFDCAHEEQVGHAGEGNFLPYRGYDSVINRLAGGLDIQLGRAVREIRWNADGVDLFFQRGSLIRAKKVVVTVPLGVLQTNQLRFTPGLPKKKTSAIQTMRMGPVKKLQLTFRRKFWDQSAAFFIDPEFGSVWWDAGVGRNRRPAMLTAFITANHQPDWLALPKRVLVTKALAELSSRWGVDCRQLSLDALFTDWTRDPWARGGYSFVPPGGYGARQALAEPVEATLFFAGEATAAESNPATVHGAIESGWRAAQEIEVSFR